MKGSQMLKFTDSRRAQEAMEGRIVELLPKGDTLRVLDVGCGSRLRVKIPEPFHLVGIDTSPEQLERNTIAQEKILGDAATYPFEPSSFDVIVCWDVLEHLPHPERALQNLVPALKPGGLLIIAMPNPCSLKGLITKLTPRWFHILAHKILLGNKNAGKPGYPPFPTYLRFVLCPKRFICWCEQHHLHPQFVALTLGGQVRTLRSRHPILGTLFLGFSSLLKVISLGTYDGTMTESYMLMEKSKE